MRKALAALAVILVVSAAAGGLFAGASADAKAPPVTVPGQINDHGTKTAKHNVIAIEEHDFYFKPTFVKATPATTLTIKLKNKSKVAHTFTTTDGSIDLELQPGKSATVEVTVPTSGGMVFYCRFHGPYGSQCDSGMQGAVFIKAGIALTGVTTTTTTTTSTTTTSTTTRPPSGSTSGGGTMSCHSGGYGY
jgi:plastocyanin